MKHFDNNKHSHNLAILSFADMKVYVYDKEFLKKHYYDIEWKDEDEVEGLESFISNVLNFNLDNIQWMEYENTIVNEEYKITIE